MHSFAFKNLWLKKTRTFLALIGLAIAIIGIVGLISISAGIRANITDILGKMEGVTVMQKGVIDDAFSLVSFDYIDDIEAIPGVKVVAPIVTGMASNIEEKGGGLAAEPLGGMIMLIGADPAKNTQLKKGSLYNPAIAKGRPLKVGDRYSAVIGDGVADKFKKSVGTTIKFNGKKFKIVGIYESGSLLADRAVGIPIEIAQEITGKDKDTASILYVELQDSKNAEKVATKINFRFENELEAKTASGYTSDIGGMLSTLDSFFIVISSVALLVGAIGILNTMLMSVSERTKEFGILKAVGWTGDDIIRLILFESLYLGIIGGVVGCCIAFLGVEILAAILPFRPVIEINLILYAFTLSVLLGVFGGVYPAWRASKLDPVQAIRQE